MQAELEGSGPAGAAARSTMGPCPVLDVGHAGPDVRAHLDALCGPALGGRWP